MKVANFACFVRNLAAISFQREQMTPHFAKTKSGLADSQRDGMAVTSSRLDKLGISIGAGLICRRIVVTGFRMIDFRVDRGRA